MPHKFDPERMDTLVSPARERDIDLYRIMSLIPISQHDVVADVGCGPGFFTVPLGKAVFHGKVHALDVQQEMLDAAQERLKSVRLTNVEATLSEENSVPLEDESMDGVFAAFMIHEVENSKVLLTDFFRSLRPGGWLALLEWHKREMECGPPLEERIDEPDLRSIAIDAGFRLTTSRGLNDKHYMLVMRK